MLGLISLSIRLQNIDPISLSQAVVKLFSCIELFYSLNFTRSLIKSQIEWLAISNRLLKSSSIVP